MTPNGFYLAVGFYAIERFAIEFFKPYGTAAFGLTLFQWMSVVLLAYAALMLASRPDRMRTVAE